jgi:hypothetical protein
MGRELLKFLCQWFRKIYRDAISTLTVFIKIFINKLIFKIYNGDGLKVINEKCPPCGKTKLSIKIKD